MATSATPVQLVDPATGIPYAAGGAATTGAPGTNATSASAVQGVSGGTPITAATLDEMNVMAGRGFSWATGVVTVPANNFFNAVFVNPAGSGKTTYVIFREFGNASSTVLQSVLRTNVTVPTGLTAVSGSNRMMGNGTTAVSTLSYGTGSTAITTGNLGPAKLLPINGEPSDNTLLRIVPPGFNFAYTVSGLTGAFAASTQLEFSLAGWEA